MTRAILFLVVLGAALLWASAHAEEERKYDRVDTATVRSVDADGGRISIASEGLVRTYEVEPATEILRGIDQIGLDAVQIGDRVIVEATDEVGDDSSQLVADRILVVVDDPS
jgi:hypothetical protein